MTKREYTSISVPVDVDADIKKIMKIGRGYPSKTQVVVDAVRHLLEQLQGKEASTQ
jgi:Arc/MetJ-type ribon-helix-helix transcriptional regulator